MLIIVLRNILWITNSFIKFIIYILYSGMFINKDRTEKTLGRVYERWVPAS